MSDVPREKLLAAHLRSKEAKLEAANNLTEARLRIERHTGALIPRMQKAGLLLSQGYSHVERHDMLAQPLTDYAITRDQSATWQKVARIPDEVFEDYLATGKENLWELSTAGLLWYASHGAPRALRGVRAKTDKLPICPRAPRGAGLGPV